MVQKTDLEHDFSFLLQVVINQLAHLARYAQLLIRDSQRGILPILLGEVLVVALGE